MFYSSTRRLFITSVAFAISLVITAESQAKEFPKRPAKYSPPVWERVVSDGAREPAAGYASAFRQDRCAMLRTTNRLRQVEGCAFVDGRELQRFSDMQSAPTESVFRREQCELLRTNNRLWRENGCRFPM